MIDPDDAHGGGGLVYSVDHTAIAASRDVVLGQFSNQRLTYPEGLLQEWAGRELDNRGGNRLGETLQCPFG